MVQGELVKSHDQILEVKTLTPVTDLPTAYLCAALSWPICPSCVLRSMDVTPL